MRSWRRRPTSGVNTITGEGLAEALAGAQVVVDVANSPSFEDKAVLEFFETSGRNLLAAEAAAGVGHHVALSVVGTDRLPDSGYFRAKLAQEKLIKASGIPYTIVRATQFFEFVGGIVQSGTDGDAIRLSPALLQPIASDDVAAALADLAVGSAGQRHDRVAGPEADPLDELARQFLARKRATGEGDRRRSRALLRRRAERPVADPRPKPRASARPLRGLAPPLIGQAGASAGALIATSVRPSGPCPSCSASASLITLGWITLYA